MQADFLLLLDNKCIIEESKIYKSMSACNHFFVKFLKNYIFTNKIVTSTTVTAIFVNQFFPLILRILA